MYRTNNSVDEFRTSVSLDVQHAQSWLLYHFPGFHTYPHYDSHAYGTVIKVVKGVKMWVFEYSPETATARTKREFYDAMSVHRGTEHVFTGDDVARYLVVAREGDIL